MNKRNEAINLLRDMSEAELDDHLRQQRRKLFEMRFQQATGQVENHRQIRVIRREIARTMTVQIETQRDLVPGTAQPEPPRPRASAQRAARAAAPAPAVPVAPAVSTVPAEADTAVADRAPAEVDAPATTEGGTDE